MGYIARVIVLANTVKANLREIREAIKIDEYNDIIITHNNTKITIIVDGELHWGIYVEKGKEEKLFIGGRSIYYSLKTKNEELKIDYKFDSPLSEDPLECANEEYLIDFVKQIIQGKSLLESALEYLPNY